MLADFNIPIAKKPRRVRSSYDPSKQTHVLCGPAVYPNIVVHSKTFVHLQEQQRSCLNWGDYVSLSPSSIYEPSKPTIIRFDPPIKLEANEAVKVVTNASGLISFRKIKKPYVKKKK